MPAHPGDPTGLLVRKLSLLGLLLGSPLLGFVLIESRQLDRWRAVYCCCEVYGRRCIHNPVFYCSCQIGPVVIPGHFRNRVGQQDLKTLWPRGVINVVRGSLDVGKKTGVVGIWPWTLQNAWTSQPLLGAKVGGSLAPVASQCEVACIQVTSSQQRCCPESS
jgi:hypothetical protein